MSFNISPFIYLGKHLQSNSIPKDIVEQAYQDNRWFTPEQIDDSLRAICNEMLDEEKINEWIKPYLNKPLKYKNVAIVMAGNIPMVGFFDLMTCLIAGCNVYIKYSSKDFALMSYIVSLLQSFGMRNIYLFDNNMSYDAVIATGGGNANRYFQHTFAHTPSILRSNRYSIAVLNGCETDDELLKLWDDIFAYFGLGCRNVSQIFAPEGYDISKLLNIWKDKDIKSSILNNGIAQQKAIKIMTSQHFIDGGYYILSLNANKSSCLGDIPIIFYNDKKDVLNYLENNKNEIQCVVGYDFTPFGSAQKPSLNDWADNINVFKFLFC